MTVSKTKAKLVDVARQLFAKMGVENTTMNDIALASKKGRRTLYTYFKSKDEIYLAVVESELDILSDMMKRVADKDISPDKKIIEMIYTRLDAVKEVVYRNGTLRANFFRDIWRVEKVRKRFDAKEMQLFKSGNDRCVGTLLRKRHRGAIYSRTYRGEPGYGNPKKICCQHRVWCTT